MMKMTRVKLTVEVELEDEYYGKDAMELAKTTLESAEHPEGVRDIVVIDHEVIW